MMLTQSELVGPKRLSVGLVRAAWARCWRVAIVSGLGLLLGLPAFPQESSRGRVVVLNMYYANPGSSEEVLQTRLVASAVRARLGLPAGRVLKLSNPVEDLPDVMWQCEFDDVSAHDRDMNARAQSPEFGSVRERMGTLLRRFERTVWRLEYPLQPDALTSTGLSADASQPGEIVVTNWYFARPQQQAAVLDLRLHASRVRSELGHPAGRVFLRINESSRDLPEVIWEMGYPDLASRGRDSEAIVAKESFGQIMDKMGTLLRLFRRGVWEIQAPLPQDSVLPKQR